MSNVVISNRSILDQRVNSIDKSKVNLPFNVTKSQIDKLMNLLQKVEIEFVNKIDKLEISKFIYGNIELKAAKDFVNNKFTLSKAYIVTMKQDYVSKVTEFYQRIIEEEKVERPVFDIGGETNLQQALKEATAEIDLSELQKTNVVLANSQMENKELQVNSSIMPNTIEPIKSVEQTPVVNLETAPVANPETTPVVEQQSIVNQQSTLTEQPKTVAEQALIPESQPIVNQQPVLPSQTIEQPQMVQTPQDYIENSVMPEQPKVKRKIFSKRGNILVIPIIVLWLGLVLFGSIKIVTNILT